VNLTDHHPFAPLPPMAWMTAGFGLILVCLAGLTVLATRTPWTGLDLRVDDADRAMVVAREPRGPAAEIPVGTPIDRIGYEAQWITLDVSDLSPEPDTRFVHLTDFHAFLERQTTIAAMLAGDTLCVEDPARTRWCIELEVRRPLSDLPAAFWLQLFVGGIGAMVGAGVWAFRRNDAAARYVGISGFALLASAGAAAVYSSRELALDGALFRLLHLVNGGGSLLFCAAFAATLWHYPQRLGRFPTGRVLIGAYGMMLLMLGAGLVGNFDLGLRLPILAGFVLTAAFAVAQWRHSREQPLNRAALMWFLLAWLGGGGAFLAVIFVPALLGHDSGAQQAYAFALFLVIYGGLALGVLRYRLFELDRWWFSAWTIAASGAVFLALDLLIVHQLGLAGDDAMLISLLVVSWLYLPLRHWLWHRLHARRSKLDVTLSALAAAQLSSPGRAWRSTVEQLFTPLRIADAQPSPPEPALADHGSVLLLPAVGSSPGLRLELPDRGRRLFSIEDLRTAAAAQAIVERLDAYRDAMNHGARQERERIARALHDDVGAALLNLLHQSSGPAREQARRALAELRLVLQGLAAHGQRLEDILGWCCGDLREYADAANVSLDWQLAEPLPLASLEAHQALLLQRCLRELIDLAGPQGGLLQVRLTAAAPELSVDACVDVPALADRPNPLGALPQRAGALDVPMTVFVEPPNRLRVELRIPLIEPTAD
jgi:signal transduction histidine kinase